jgi:gas vesicle protein
MWKLFSFALGLLLGAAVGAALVMLFAPTSGNQLAADIKRSYDDTMDEARQAAENRRRELEAELARRRSLVD